MIKTIITAICLLLCITLYSAYVYCMSCIEISEFHRRVGFAVIILFFIISAKCSEWIGCSSAACKDLQRIFWFSLISVFILQIIHYSLHINNIYEKLFIFNGAIIIYAVATISASVRHGRYK